MLRNFLILLCVSLIWASSLKHVPFKPVKDLGPRIINGDQAVLGQFPWQAAIIIESPLGKRFCGGTIISEEWILTAGHCVHNGHSATVTVGSVRIPYSANEYSSAELVLHENFDPYFLTNDIGLIRLSKNLTFRNDNVQPIVLSSKPLDAGVNITVSGWGITHDANPSVSSNLNYITVRTITNQKCKQFYGQGSIPDSVVCAEDVGNILQSPCNGDSGGPVVTDASSNPVHVAVVSFVSTKGCESGFPAGFTRTAFYIEWIKSKLDQSDQPDQTDLPDEPDQSGGNGADLIKFSWVTSLLTVIVIKTIIIP